MRHNEVANKLGSAMLHKVGNKYNDEMKEMIRAKAKKLQGKKGASTIGEDALPPGITFDQYGFPIWQRELDAN
jgi:hypothetical protein